jgi:nicotinamide mononucleotide transporter
VEWIATLFGVACVWLCVRRSIWNWPTGLVQVVLYAWVFFHARLYADFGLHVIYTVLQLYGWYHWLNGSNDSQELPVTRWPARSAAGWLIVAAVATLVVGFALHRSTDAALPYWDATIAILSLIAQYLLARKVLENWLIWIVVDVLAIGVYLAKELYVTSGLYAVFLCMAIAGWFAWRASYRKSNSVAGAGLSSENSSRRTPDTSSSSTSPAFTVQS